MSAGTGAKPRPVFLVGYMGSGKTTLGHAVSEAAHLPFIDLDDAIVAEAGKAVGAIFAEEGEAGFRRRENAMLRRVAASPAIVACGGGTPLQPGNMELMNSMGTTVWLKASPRRLHERLTLYRGDRPLLKGLDGQALMDFITEALSVREPFYAAAAHIFDADSLDTPAQLRDSVRTFVLRFISENPHNNQP